MKYRVLSAEDWGLLQAIMQPEFIPHPESARAVIAEDDSGNIAGVLFAQLAMHTEPLILLDKRARFDRLYETLIDSFKENTGLHVYCFSDSEIIDKMAEHVGMKATKYRVFEGEVT